MAAFTSALLLFCCQFRQKLKEIELALSHRAPHGKLPKKAAHEIGRRKTGSKKFVNEAISGFTFRSNLVTN